MNVNFVRHAQKIFRVKQQPIRPDVVFGNFAARERNFIFDKQPAPNEFIPRRHVVSALSNSSDSFGQRVGLKRRRAHRHRIIGGFNFLQVVGGDITPVQVNNIGVEFFCERVHFLKRSLRDEIIVVHKVNIFAARKHQTAIARKRTLTGIFFHVSKRQSPAETLNKTFDDGAA